MKPTAATHTLANIALLERELGNVVYQEARLAAEPRGDEAARKAQKEGLEARREQLIRRIQKEVEELEKIRSTNERRSRSEDPEGA